MQGTWNREFPPDPPQEPPIYCPVCGTELDDMDTVFVHDGVAAGCTECLIKYHAYELYQDRICRRRR